MKLSRFQEWSLANPAFMCQEWPDFQNLTWRQAFNMMKPGQGEALQERLRLAKEVDQTPTVAITGLINSGKSSLVSLFLSQSGRSRVLRGFGDRGGTHRFTLWVPAGWGQKEDFFFALREKLKRSFGSEPELLDDRPERAQAQQRDQNRLGIPLLALDPALDRLRFCLLDCPDAQRKSELEKEGQNLRLDLLEQASAFCSGIVFVTTRRDLQVRQAEEILRRMPGAVRFFAINMCRPEDVPEAVRTEAETAFRVRDEDRVFIAYDFLIERNRQRSPHWDRFWEIPPEQRDQLAFPSFFEVLRDPVDNHPERVGQNRSILALPTMISPEVMREKRHREHLDCFSSEWNRSLQELLSWMEKKQRSTDRAVSELVAEFNPLFQHEGEEKFLATPRLLTEMNESFMRTSPLLVRPFWKLRVRTEKMFKDLFTRQIREVLPRGAKAVSEMNRRKEGLREKTVPMEKMARSLENWVEKRGFDLDPETSRSLAEKAMELFFQAEESALSPEEWDRLTKALWREIPRWKALTIGAAVSLSLGALFLIPLDGGVVSLTIGQLLSVLGLGGLVSVEVLRKQMNQSLGAKQKRYLLAALGQTLQLGPHASTWPWRCEEDQMDSDYPLWPTPGPERHPWVTDSYRVDPEVVQKVFPLHLD